KEAERHRRGNIKKMIDELGRIVPCGPGDTAKTAIISHAVQYIHQLRQNETRDNERCTLERLLFEQAIGELNVQLANIRRMWEEECKNRRRAEQELEDLRKHMMESCG
ncbi:hypothetical protein B0H13DRAFT_1552106, partial [Mycena leptocephala]